jgi:hypothetical protein
MSRRFCLERFYFELLVYLHVDIIMATSLKILIHSYAKIVYCICLINLAIY